MFFLYSPINRADIYLRPLSLHTIKNYAKIGDHDVTQLVEKYMDDIIFI